MRLILNEDCNVHFAKCNSKPLVEFMKTKLNLTINSRVQATTKYKTTTDAIFSRFLDIIKSCTFVSYFKYHQPIYVELYTK